MKYRVLLCAAFVIISGCQAELVAESGRSSDAVKAVSVTPSAETVLNSKGVSGDPKIWIDSVDPEKSLILGAAEKGPLEAYALDGTSVGITSKRPIGLFDIRYNFPLAGKDVGLIVGYDASVSELVGYTLDVDNKKLNQLFAQPQKMDLEIEGICLFQSPISGEFFVFAVGDGAVQQWILSGQSDGHITAQHVRTVPVGLGATRCEVHDRSSTLFFSQESVGVWKLGADPESKGTIEPVDLIEPFGSLAGDVEGLSIYEDATGGGFLVISDTDAGQIRLYDLQTLDNIGAVSVNSGKKSGGVEEAKGLTVTSMPLSKDYADGILVLTDEKNDGERANYKMVSWGDISSSLGLASAPAYNPLAKKTDWPNRVRATVETVPVSNYGDAADDPAIWVHPTSPELSLILGTQKKRGINVYDLSGELIQSRPDGRINNVDLRYGFSLAGKLVDVVTVSNRTTDGIGIYIVDVATRTLVDMADGLIPSGMEDPYGQCMYKSPKSGQYYVFINDKNGIVKQWVLEDNNGRIAARLVREFDAGTQTEGCVADDETGDLYLGEENVGIWKYSAEPDGGEGRIKVDDVSDDGNLTADVEGLAIYYGPNGAGYLIASNQGADNYAVYERGGDNKFLGYFYMVADIATGIDGSAETDGLDVTSATLGPNFPNGVFVVQDGRNIMPDERQNYKLVPWEQVAKSLGLDISSGYDPRVGGKD